MGLSRIVEILLARWAVVLGVGVVGLIGAVAFTSMGNSNRIPLIQATAPVVFEAQEGQTLADLENVIGDTVDLARVAAGALLAADPAAQIVPDVATRRVLFVAVGNSREEAAAKAEALRQSFFDLDPAVGRNVDELLEEVEDEAVAVGAEMAELNPRLTPEELELQARYDLIDQQIAAIRDRLVALTVAEAVADDTQLAEIEAERTRLSATLERLQEERAALPPRPDAEATVEEQLRLNSLQRRLDLLMLEYERLYLRKLGVTDTGRAEPVTVVDLTPPPADVAVNGAIGLAGGLLIGIFGLALAGRVRKSAWIPEDLPVTLLGQVPARRVGATIGESWYDTIGSHPRKQAVQALRSAVEAQLPAAGGTLAVTFQNVDDAATHALTADLAASMASAGSSVLLVDADFEGDAAIGQYRAGGTSLSAVVGLKPESPGFDADLAALIDGAYLIRPGLAVVPAGPPPPSPADALAGRQFRSFVEKASKQFDFIVVAVGDIASPAAQVAMQRLRRALLVIVPGRSTIPELEGHLLDVAQRQVQVIGAVFLERRERRRSRSRPPRPGRPATDESALGDEIAPGESPVSRLSHYPVPGVDSSALVAQDPLLQLVDRLGSLDPSSDGGLGAALVAALRVATPEEAHDAVAEYLVSRVEDILSVSHAQGGRSAALVSEVVDNGFVTLRPLTGHPTMGQWLGEEISRESDSHTAIAIIDGMERILSGRVGRAIQIDEWLAEQFFSRHLARTGGEPTVWHLTSEEGTVQLLVPVRRLDSARIEGLVTGVTTSLLDELERFGKAASTRGDGEQAEVFQRRIEEVRRFQRALGSLIGYGEEGKGRRRGASGWSPDWSNGYRANLAPLQELGLLPFPVLSSEELAGLDVLG